MIKVLYVSPNGYLGGAERFVLTAVKGHTKVKASILYYSNGEAVEEAQRDDLEYVVLKNKFRLSRPLKLLRALFQLREIVKKHNPDIIHSTMPYAHITMSLATIGMPQKRIWFQHGPVNGLLDQVANLFPVDSIFYNSEDLKRRHHKTKPRARIASEEVIINLGVKATDEIPRFNNHKRLRLGTAGRICSWKGFHHLILALKELKNDSWELEIAGSAKSPVDQNYHDQLIALTNSSGLEGKIKFLNHVSDMTAFYHSIDIFIHCSTIPEPFGLVVAEAMGHGCLVIGSSEGGVSDLLHENQTGYTFDSTGPNAITELHEVLSLVVAKTPQELSVVATAGQALIREKYSVQGMIDQLEQSYLKVR